MGHGADVSPGPASGEALAKGVGIISPIRQKNVSPPHAVEHILGAPAIVGLALGELQGDGQAHGIDESVDFRRQTAP